MIDRQRESQTKNPRTTRPIPGPRSATTRPIPAPRSATTATTTAIT